MIIKKDKNIVIKLTILCILVLVFLTILAYLLGWLEENIKTNNYKELLIFSIAIVVEIVAPTIISIIIILCTKKYYEITDNSIKFFNGATQLFELSKEDIVKMEYVRFRWALLMQFGGGGLNIEYVNNDNIKPSIAMQGQWKKYVIYVSYKQVSKISEILKMPIYKV